MLKSNFLSVPLWFGLKGVELRNGVPRSSGLAKQVLCKLDGWAFRDSLNGRADQRDTEFNGFCGRGAGGLATAPARTHARACVLT